MSFRSKFFGEHSSKEAGLAPGSLVHVGKKHPHKPTITVIDYNKEHFHEEVVSIADCANYKHDNSVTWVNINGVHDTKLIKEIGEQFDLHPLILEDLLNTKQRPKVEEYKDTIFVVARMMRYDENDTLHNEQISFVLANNFVLSFQEQPGDVFDPLRERLRNASGRIRSRKSDYLLYALLDSIVDNYFLIIEQTGIQVEELEELILHNYDKKTINQAYELKREIINFQRYVWPLREVTTHLLRAEHNTFNEETLLFLRDLQDHTIQIIDSIQLSREMINGMIDLSMNQASNRMNEVMKVLTIIATIFIPLTFIAGIYGMNFEYMPELTYHYGYHITWAVMIAVTIGMIAFFKNKNWL